MKFITRWRFVSSYLYWQKNGGEKHSEKHIEQSAPQDHGHSQARLVSYLGGEHGLVPVQLVFYSLFAIVKESQMEYFT